MKTAGRNEHTISSVFVFLLITVFVIFSMLMIMLGIRAYHSTEVRSGANSSYRLLSSYVRSKIRAEDGFAEVRTENIDGIDMLTLGEDYDGEKYVTRIYCSDGKLREWFSREENPFEPAAGDEICAAQGFEASVQENLLTARMQDENGEWIETSIVLYAGGAGRVML